MIRTRQHSLLVGIAFLILTLACSLTAKTAGRRADPLWEKPLQPAPFPHNPIYADGLFFALDESNTLFAWEENTGKTVWQTPALRFRLNADRTSLLVQQPDQTCARLALSNGALLETLPNELGHICRPDLKNDTDTLYTFRDPDQLIATHALTGEVLWQVPLNLPPEVSSSSIFPQPPEWDDDLLARNGRVLVHTTSFKEGDDQHGYFNFQAFDALTGSVVWQVVGQAHGTVIYDETRVYLIYTDEFVDYDAFGDLTIPLHIHAHDLSTGQELWQGEWIGLNFYHLSDGVLYSCQKGQWRWLDAATGQELGKQTLALPAATGGCLLLNNPATNLLGRQVAFQISREVSQGYTFELGNVPYDTWLNAYSLETGKPLWSTEILLENPISIAALGQDTILLWWDGQLRAYAIAP